MQLPTPQPPPASDVVERYFARTLTRWRILPVPAAPVTSAATLNELRATLGRVRRNLEANQEQFRVLVGHYEQAVSGRLNARTARLLMSCGLVLDPAAFGLADWDSPSVVAAEQQAAGRVEQLGASFAQYEELHVQRLTAARDLVRHPESAAHLGLDGHQVSTELERPLRSVARLHGAGAATHALRERLMLFDTLHLQMAAYSQPLPQAQALLQKEAPRLRGLIENIAQALATPGLVEPAEAAVDTTQKVEQARRTLQRIDAVYHQALSRAATLAERIEQTIGLAPLGPPQETMTAQEVVPSQEAPAAQEPPPAQASWPAQDASLAPEPSPAQEAPAAQEPPAPESFLPSAHELTPAGSVATGEIPIEVEEVIPLKADIYSGDDPDGTPDLFPVPVDWHERVAILAAVWERHGRHPSALLRGSHLATTRNKPDQDLGRTERRFVQSSQHRQEKEGPRRKRLLGVLGTVVVLLLVAFGGFKFRTAQMRGEVESLSLRVAEIEALHRNADALARALAEEDPLTRVLMFANLAEDYEPEGGVARFSEVVQGEVPVAVLRGHTGAVTHLTFDAGKDADVTTLSEDGTVRLASIDGRADSRVLSESGNKPVTDITSVAWSPRAGKTSALPDLATGSQSGEILLWVDRGKRVNRELTGHDAEIVDLDWNSDGTVLVSAARDSAPRLWPVRDNNDPTLLRGHRGDVLKARFQPFGSQVLTVSLDGTARVWSPGGSRRAVMEFDNRSIYDAAWSPDGRRIATLDAEGSVHVWNNSGENPVLVHRGEVFEETTCGPVWSADGGTIVTGLATGDVLLHDLSSSEASAPMRLEGHQEQVTSAVWKGDGFTILTTSNDGTARIWRIFGGGEPRVLRGHAGPVLAAAWSPDGKNVLTAAADRTLRVWPLTPVQLPQQDDWAAGIQAVRELTSACLTPNRRRGQLGELAAAARAAYEACEKKNQRHPLSDKVLRTQGGS